MLRTGLAVLATVVALTGGAQAQSQARCSNATIQGDWTFTVHGNALTLNGATSLARIDGVGIISFDGFGSLRQQDFIVVNGVHPPPDGFHRNESGTYQVGADCTGFATINFDTDKPQDQRSAVDLAFVISRTGRSIHTVVSAARPNDSLRQVYSDLEKADMRP